MCITPIAPVSPGRHPSAALAKEAGEINKAIEKTSKVVAKMNEDLQAAHERRLAGDTSQDRRPVWQAAIGVLERIITIREKIDPFLYAYQQAAETRSLAASRELRDFEQTVRDELGLLPAERTPLAALQVRREWWSLKRIAAAGPPLDTGIPANEAALAAVLGQIAELKTAIANETKRLAQAAARQREPVDPAGSEPDWLRAQHERERQLATETRRRLSR